MELSRPLRSAFIAVAATLLYTIAPAQWTATLDYGLVPPDNDQGKACCVDHIGNVYVVGHVYTGSSHGYDAEVVKYSSSGTELWRKNYNGPDNKDDYGTAVCCDWNNNVYMTGISKDGSSNGHFFVWKLDPAGFVVWPTSGSYTGYQFDSAGALRLTDSDKDGWDSYDGVYRCAMAMDNSPGAQPTFAITGPSIHSGSTACWKTVAFENDGSGGVQMKSGWPVRESSTLDGDSVSYGIAIYSDLTVYVTGTQHSSSSTEDQIFQTVHYYADGSARYWTDQWAPATDNKVAVGKAIDLDKDGNAYVAGSVSAFGYTDPSGTMYGTREIDKTSGTSHWSNTYQYVHGSSGTSGGVDGATSISVSFEIVSGALTPYVYVTGHSQHSSGGQYDIATLRYKGGSDGTDQWSGAQRYDSGYDDFGLHVVAAGYGNAYVVGSTKADGVDSDYVLLGYDRSGSTRFSTVTKNGSGDGNDEARWIVMGGAGLMYFTGLGYVSQGINSSNDFLTVAYGQTQSTDAPNGVSAVIGNNPAGDYTYLATDDGSAYSVSAVHTGSLEEASVEVTGQVSTTATEMSLTIDSSVSGPGASNVTEKVEVYDYLNSQYVEVSEMAVSTSDSLCVIPLRDDARQFRDSSGNVKVRITCWNTGSTLYGLGIDFVQWQTIN